MIRTPITAAAPARTDNVIATASPHDTGRTGNASDQARQVTTGARRRTFSPA
jgi:hypothetical protein